MYSTPRPPFSTEVKKGELNPINNLILVLYTKQFPLFPSRAER
jgi:hypothetical protein